MDHLTYGVSRLGAGPLGCSAPHRVGGIVFRVGQVCGMFHLPGRAYSGVAVEGGPDPGISGWVVIAVSSSSLVLRNIPSSSLSAYLFHRGDAFACLLWSFSI